MKKVLYTLDAFPDEAVEKESWFNRVMAPQALRYVQRCGAKHFHLKKEIIEHDPPHYHKLDIFKAFIESEYDRAIFMDMDIYIEDACPDLWETFPEGTSMVFDYLMPVFDNYEPWINDTWPGEKPQMVYNGITKHNHSLENPWRYFNTGVIVFDKEFAQFMLDKITKVTYPEGDTKWPNGWGEQHYFNFVMDKHSYPIKEMPRKANEITGLTENQGEWISHYAAPWGKSRMAQREIHKDQASFQRKYLKGDILNVGCNDDYAGLKRDFGAYNVDIYDTDKTTGMRNAHDEIADARDLPEKFDGKYDTVVLGEILEHFKEEDRRKAIMAAKKAMKENGWLNMTFPQDYRPLRQQRREDIDETLEYTPGVSAFHAFILEPSMVIEDLESCGMKVLRREAIHYPFDGIKGTALLACKPDYWQRTIDNMELIFNTD